MQNLHRKILALAACGAFPCTLAVSNDGGAFQSLAEVADAARQFAAGISQQIGARRETQAAALDVRLHLTPCKTPLQTSLAPGARSPTRITVQVKCADVAGWKVYVPVDVKFYDHVVVATRAVDRGVALAPADLAVEERETSSLPSSYMRNPAELAGFTLARPVVAGTVISPSLVAADHVIHRGDIVTLIAQTGSMTVRAQGRAMADAAMRERIKVRNLGSGRQVEGLVVGAGEVEVAFR